MGLGFIGQTGYSVKRSWDDLVTDTSTKYTYDAIVNYMFGNNLNTTHTPMRLIDFDKFRKEAPECAKEVRDNSVLYGSEKDSKGREGAFFRVNWHGLCTQKWALAAGNGEGDIILSKAMFHENPDYDLNGFYVCDANCHPENKDEWKFFQTYDEYFKSHATLRF